MIDIGTNIVVLSLGSKHRHPQHLPQGREIVLHNLIEPVWVQHIVYVSKHGSNLVVPVLHVLIQVVHAATTKSERFNRFVQWVAFGGNSVIAEDVRDEQRKFIKYNHLVANLLVFYNVVTMTKALRQLEADGHLVSHEVLAALSPYQTEHINRSVPE